jgi:UDP-N-acetylmuramyl tripeptide synthase
MIEPGVREAGLTQLTMASLNEGARGFVTLVDRREAIARAIATASPGDTVLIAGKGHEDYQIVGTKKQAFDDALEAARALRARESL